jgi:hypothetical protein
MVKMVQHIHILSVQCIGTMMGKVCGGSETLPFDGDAQFVRFGILIASVF